MSIYKQCNNFSKYGIFFWSVSKLEYYLKVFLNQEVAPNFQLDIEMTKSLGELYPRQIRDLTLIWGISYELKNNNDDHRIFFTMFLDGVNPFTKATLITWSERLTAADNWLETLALDFKNETDKELYEIAVINIEKQELKDYLFFFKPEICIKLTKEQYLRFLKFHIWWVFYFKRSREYWLSILKEEIGDVDLAEIHEYLHGGSDLYELFPQVFPELKLLSIDDLNHFDFLLGEPISIIYKNYSIMLFARYYKWLPLGFFAEHNIDIKDIPMVTANQEELQRYAATFFTFLPYEESYHKVFSLLGYLSFFKDLK